ncbi:MAG: acyltransferase family protein [Rhodomicrobium sp.]
MGCQPSWRAPCGVRAFVRGRRRACAGGANRLTARTRLIRPGFIGERAISQQPNYRPDIDGLRAVAVLSVVFYHAGLPGFPGGFVGVDVFFVISGYLITGIIWPALGDGSFSLQNFYVRRIKRIFPALYTVLLFCTIAAFFLLIPGDLVAFGRFANATVLFFSNFHAIKVADYFAAPAIETPLLHTWSLSVEEQFYAAWPLILLLLNRAVPAKKVPYAILVLALVSLALAEARMPDYQKDAFYLPWCRAWELLLGAGLAVSPVLLRPGRLATALGIAGLGGIAVAVALYDTASRFPGFTALLPCAGAGFIIAAGNPANPVSRLLSIGPIRHIGLISYSLYLIHWPLLSFAHLYFSEELTLVHRLAIALTSVALAHLSWRFIETPCRAARLPEVRVFGVAAAAMGVLLIAGVSFSQSGGFPYRASEAVLQLEKKQSVIPQYCRPVHIPGIEGGGTCELGENHGGRYDFIVWGDSHAVHFAPALTTLASNRKISGLLFSMGGCQPFLDDPQMSRPCRKFNASVSRWVRNNSVKLAILGGRWSSHLRYLRRFLAEENPAQNKGGLAKTLAFLSSVGAEVSLLEQVPEFAMPVRACVARAIFYGRGTGACVMLPREVFESKSRTLNGYFAFLKKRYSFSVASAAGVLCNQEQCLARSGDTLLMSDNNHLSVAGALHVMPYLSIPLLTGPRTEEAEARETEPSASGSPPL